MSASRVICVENKLIVLQTFPTMKDWSNCESVPKQKSWYASKHFLSRFTDEKIYWKNYFFSKMEHLLTSQKQFVRDCTDKFNDRWVGRDRCISWASRSLDLTYCFWSFFHGGYIKKVTRKTRIKEPNDLKTRITQEIQSIEKRTQYVVFAERGQTLDLCISLEGNTDE